MGLNAARRATIFYGSGQEGTLSMHPSLAVLLSLANPNKGLR